ncbi:MAG: heme-copper oxidase subunit III, partial [Myxococcales bacterium]|nr:heme-copper oxidase subunit III [Myxococcales bacterium]
MSARTPASAMSPAIPWGKLMMGLFLASDAMGFAGLLTAYAVLRAGAASWPDASGILDIPLTALNTAILVGSSYSMTRAEAAARAGHRRGLVGFLALTAAAGAVFLAIQAYEWSHLLHAGVTASRETFAGVFFATTGFHGLHVLAGVGYLAYVLRGARAGRYDGGRTMAVEAAG